MAPPLVLHSSRVRLSLQAITPVFLLALGGIGLLDGAGVVPIVLTLFGLATAAVALFDLPLRTEFDDDGIVRVCVLRRHHLPWTRVVALERTGAPARSRQEDGSDRRPRTSQGLVARTGPRRLHLLVDRRESHAEWAALRDLLHDRATRLRAAEPPLDAAPAGRGPRALHRRAAG